MHTHSFLPAPFCRAAQGSAIFPIERFVGGGGGGGAILPRSTGVARHWPARLRLRSTGAAPYWLGRLPSESVVTGAGECADGLRNARRDTGRSSDAASETPLLTLRFLGVRAVPWLLLYYYTATRPGIVRIPFVVSIASGESRAIRFSP